MAHGPSVWSVQAYGLVLLWSGRMEKAYGPSVWSVQAYGPCRRMVWGRMVWAYGPSVWSMQACDLGRMVRAYGSGV